MKRFLILFFLAFWGMQWFVLAQSLPPLQVYPLPPALSQWQDQSNSGDYFDQIKLTPVNYLLWTEFPIKIYIPQPSQRITPQDRQFDRWFTLVQQGVMDWNQYLPLQQVTSPDYADIQFDRADPPITRNQRAKTAQTRYQFYSDGSVLKHRMIVTLSPHLSDPALLSASRHEMGHALGIWGHSPLSSDVLYFSQVRDAPSISIRDVNTLKKIYQQPTRLGKRP